MVSGEIEGARWAARDTRCCPNRCCAARELCSWLCNAGKPGEEECSTLCVRGRSVCTYQLPGIEHEPRNQGEPRKQGAPHAAARRGRSQDHAYDATCCGGGRAPHEESHAGGHCQSCSSATGAALQTCSALAAASSSVPACAFAGAGVACRGERSPCRSCLCAGCGRCSPELTGCLAAAWRAHGSNSTSSPARSSWHCRTRCGQCRPWVVA